MPFYRQSTDRRRHEHPELENSFAGTEPTACWIIGGGPSLLSLHCETIAAINNSPAPKMAVNFAGRGPDYADWLIRPDFFTTFDPTPRFLKSAFLDPRITKFLLGGRVLDLVPGTSFKVCDCPRTFFIDHEKRGFADFLSPASPKIIHCLDSFCQALDICFRLGFRIFYCLGTELIVRPSPAQIEVARAAGVRYEDGWTLVPTDKRPDGINCSDRLSDFLGECVRAGLGVDRTSAAKSLEEWEREAQYAFPETKRLLAAAATDDHYWRTAQYLRLSRRNFALNGVRLVSCTQGSRLNAFFPTLEPEAACEALRASVGDPAEEATAGRYSGQHDPPGHGFPAMQDILPYDQPAQVAREVREAAKENGAAPGAEWRNRVKQRLDAMDAARNGEDVVKVNEVG